MKLQEIRDRLEDLQQMRIDETIDDYSQRVWDGLPRMPFKELPLSLQREARKRHTTDTIRSFLQDCYSTKDFESLVKSMSPEEQQRLPSPPEAYVSFDTIAAGVPAEDLDKVLTRARNTAIYTVEYEGGYLYSDGTQILAPMLYSNFAKEAFESAVRDYRLQQQERQRKKGEQEKYKKDVEQAKRNGEKPPQKPQPRPKREGIIVSAGYYQCVISDPEYQHSLTTQINKNAYIALMTPDFFKRMDFSHEDGVLSYDQKAAGIIRQSSQGKYEDIKDLDFPLLTQIFTATVKARIRQEGFTVTVSMPDFFREMGVSTLKGNAPNIIAKLKSFEECVGIMPGMGTISKLFIILDIDAKNQTMTFAVPYMIRLCEVLEGKNRIERTTRTGETLSYIKPFHNSLVHSTIASERNKPAVELVYLITNGLLQRGYVPDIKTYRKKGAKTQCPDRITYSITYRSLINEAPLLRGRIQSYEARADQNRALRRAFEKAYHLIATKTDAAEWFIDLHYGKIIPTMTTLDDELVITHEGKNGDYQRKK